MSSLGVVKKKGWGGRVRVEDRKNGVRCGNFGKEHNRRDSMADSVKWKVRKGEREKQGMAWSKFREILGRIYRDVARR